MLPEIPEMEDHSEYVTFDPETKTAICSECEILIDFNRDMPQKVGGDKWANHSFGRDSIKITSMKVRQHDDRLDVFKEFIDKLVEELKDD